MSGAASRAGHRLRGWASALTSMAVVLALVSLSGAIAAAADIAVVRIEYRFDDVEGQRVASEGDKVSVIAYVKNLGSEPVRNVTVSYVYINEVTGFRYVVPGTYPVAQIAAGRVEPSATLNWDIANVGPGRYHFEATAQVAGADDDVPCNSVFPRQEADCPSVEGTQPTASIVIQADDEDLRLVQALFHDPVPLNDVRLPSGCIVSFTSSGKTVLSGLYSVPLVNVGGKDSDEIEREPEEDADSGYMGYTWSTSGWVEQEGLLSGVLLTTSEEGSQNDEFEFGRGARYVMSFRLNLDSLVESSFAKTAIPNLAEPVEVSIQVKLYDEDAPNDDLYNRFTVPEGANAASSTLDAYAPVIKWLYPGCEMTTSDRPLGVAPGLRTGLQQPRLYVAVVDSDGEYYVRVARVTDKGLEIRWLADDIPLHSRPVGFAFDEVSRDFLSSVGIVYVSCDDGSIVAIEDTASLLDEDSDSQPKELWRKTGVGQALSRPVIVEASSRTMLLVAADDGLHLAPSDGSGVFEWIPVTGPSGETISISSAPLPVGSRAYFAGDGWIGRIDVGDDDVAGSLEILPVEAASTELAKSDDGRFVFFGTETGRVYALGVSEPMVSLARAGRSLELQSTGAARVTALEAMTNEKGEAWLFASTLDGGIYKVMFDLDDGEFDSTETVSLVEELDELTDLPIGGLAGISIYSDPDIDHEKLPVLSIGLHGELLAYRGDLKERLSCQLWGKLDKDQQRVFLFDIGAPLSSWTAWEASNTRYLVLTSEETGQLYGLDLSYLAYRGKLVGEY